MAKKTKNEVEFLTQPELIVVVKDDAQLTTSGDTVATASNVSSTSLNKLLKSKKLKMTPLYGTSEEEVDASIASLNTEQADQLQGLSLYYFIDYPENANLDDLCQEFCNNDLVETAYIKPGAEPATYMDDTLVEEAPQDIVDSPAPVNFVSRQGYLNQAPGGIDARYAWTQSGGKGQGIKVVDVEGGWNFNHEDLRQNQGGVIAGTNSTNSGWRNHGTAVIGVIGGDENTIGITGIAPRANTRAVSIFGTGMSSSRAIKRAADSLQAGDVILIELHRAGPRFNFQARADQKGYIAMEWWPDDYNAILYASLKGIIVVEAAGNGAENLNSSIYNNKPASFPSSWSNPFRRSTYRDSGAIIVGAGAPPPGTHGRNHGPDRSRLNFSNYGSCVDAQGWGREVTTTGYGNLFGGGNQNRQYTDTFSGTSSASPIVVGAIACTQGVLKARGRILLTPARVRDLLRSTGSPQTSAPGRPRSQRIGNRPNLRQLIARALHQNNWFGVQFSGKVPSGASRRWFTHSWPAHWIVHWDVIPTAPLQNSPAQLEFKVQRTRQSHKHVKYYIEVKNLSNKEISFDARYAVLGW